MVDELKVALRSYLGEKGYSRTRRTFYELLGQTREVFPSVGALPDFFIVGASKSGTTSLYNYLLRHPNILPASDKEVHFFDHHYGEGEVWYRCQFPTKLELGLRNAITGEATPYYLYHPLIPERIHRLVPQAKIIVLLRNPVDRTISDYWHAVKRKHETLPLKEALEQEETRLASEEEKLRRDPSYKSYHHRWHSYKARSVYVTQIRRYARLFDPEQILVVRSEDLFTNTQSTYDQVATFLNLESFALPDQRAHNAGSYMRKGETDVREMLEEYFEPYNERLYRFLGIDEPWW